jgi:hypothetical protein
VAISNKSGLVKYQRNGEMTCLTEFLYLADHEIEECVAVTMEQLYQQTGKNIDLMKLDCEGGEYHILADPNFEPIPKQITVEFHRHICPEIHDKYIVQVLANLAKYYDCVFSNEQDSLFIRR